MTCSDCNKDCLCLSCINNDNDEDCCLGVILSYVEENSYLPSCDTIVLMGCGNYKAKEV